MSPHLINGPHSQTDFNPIIQFLADHVGGALDRGVTRRTDEGERVGVAEFGQVVLVPPLPALIEINRLQKIAARRDIGSSTGPEVGDRKLLLRRFGQEQVSDGDMGEVGDGLDLGESGPLLLGQPPVPVREPAAHVIIIAASTALRPLQYAGSYDGAHGRPPSLRVLTVTQVNHWHPLNCDGHGSRFAPHTASSQFPPVPWLRPRSRGRGGEPGERPDCARGARGPSAQERRAAGVSGTARRRAGPALPTGRICRSAVRLPGACPRPSRAIAPIIPPRGPGGSSGPRPAPQRRRTRRPSPPGPESGRSADATEGF